MRIGGVTVDPPLVLAPMAGATDHPFRMLVKEQGCGLLYTEMISAKGLIYGGGSRYRPLLFFDEAERPVAFQIFGSDPSLMAEAALRLEDHGADLIDLNFGCPARKILRNGEGGALLQNPSLCSAIMEAVVRAVRLPVTVKIRTGWSETAINAARVAALAEEAGVRAVAVHGRTVAQGFRGAADWSAISRVARSISLPVIGNGDVRTPAEGASLLQTSGCAAIMIGRAALGNPWIFRRMRSCLERGEDPGPPTRRELIETALRHLEMLCRFKGERVGVREMRRHAGYYLRGLPGAASLRERLVRAVTREEMAALLASIARPMGTDIK